MNEITGFEHMIYRKDLLERIVELAGDADEAERAELEALDIEAYACSATWHSAAPLIRLSYLEHYTQERNEAGRAPCDFLYVCVPFRGVDYAIRVGGPD